MHGYSQRFALLDTNMFQESRSAFLVQLFEVSDIRVDYIRHSAKLLVHYTSILGRQSFHYGNRVASPEVSHANVVRTGTNVKFYS